MGMEHKRAARGALLTMLGGVLWGFSGTCGQFLMQSRGVSSNWLVPVRLMAAGALLLLICFAREGRGVFRIWQKDAPGILVFGLLGMSMCQYTYFTAISASNAGTATVLQYIGPVIIMLYLSVRRRRLPRPVELLAVTLAVLGTFLLATHGQPGSMVMSGRALCWGLLSAVSLAVYTVQPGRLLEEYGSAVVTAWGMLSGGVMLCALFRPWTIPTPLTADVLAGMAAVILLGTVASFSAYMEGVRCIGPKRGSLLASVEPVSATVFSVLWMKADFGMVDLLGFVCILSTVFLLARDRQGEG